MHGQMASDLDKWDYRFLRMAMLVSHYSKDPMSKIGSVLVSHDRRYLSYGYNGFPRGISDDGRLHDRDLKRKLVEHAERNCLHNSPFDAFNLACTLYVTAPCCTECTKAIIQHGVRRVVYLPFDFVGYWLEDLKLAKQMFQEAGVVLVEADPELLQDPGE